MILGKALRQAGVFLAHIYAVLDELGVSGTKILLPFSFFGGMGVLIFFFLGGYGIFKSYEAKGNLEGYWYRRLKNVYVPAMCIEAGFAIVQRVLFQTGDVGTILWTTFFGAWYIDVVMLQYAFFFVGICLFKDRIERVIAWMLGCDAVAFIIFGAMDLNARWRNSLLLFTFGVLLAWKEKQILILLRQRWMQVNSVSILDNM